MKRFQPRRLLGLLIAGTLLAASCGGGGDDTSGDDPPSIPRDESEDPRSDEQLPDEPVDREPDQPVDQEPDEPAGPQLPCTNPGPEEIGLGVPVTGGITGAVSEACFWIEVPDGLTSLTVGLSGLTGQLGLNVGYGFLGSVQYPGSLQYWDAYPGESAEGSTVIDDPEPGPYFIRVARNRPNAESSFDLSVVAEPATTTQPTGGSLAGDTMCERPATEIPLDSSIDSGIAGGGTANADLPAQYFCVMVPDGLGNLSVDLDVSGIVEVNVWHPSTFNTKAYNQSSEGELALVVESPQPGPHYIEVSASQVGIGADFTLRVGS